MTPTDLTSLFASMEAGETSRSAILGQLGYIHDVATTIRMDRKEEWARIRAHQGTYWSGTRSLFHVEWGHIDSFESNTGTTISPSFRQRGYKGDGDSFDSVTIPMDWLTLSNEVLHAALTAQFDGYLAAAKAAEDKRAVEMEAIEKAQLAALLAKHGPPLSIEDAIHQEQDGVRRRQS